MQMYEVQYNPWGTPELRVSRYIGAIIMEFFNQTYIALRGPTGAPQTAIDTIRRLSDRLTQATQISDRRAAVLSLKGLSREYKQDVGQFALAPLLLVLENDAKLDEDIGKAVLETLTLLCEVEADILPGPSLKHERELTIRHVDALLGTPSALDALLALLALPMFYSRLGALKLLSVLLQHRKSVVQDRIIQTQATDSILSVLDEKSDIMRNGKKIMPFRYNRLIPYSTEALPVLQALIASHFELQKVLAFGGVFEKLFSIIRAEQGLDGGALVQDCFSCIDGILRFNAPAQVRWLPSCFERFSHFHSMSDVLSRDLHARTNVTLIVIPPHHYAG